eukprot:12120304-Karenia_brevis.AAC.1
MVKDSAEEDNMNMCYKLCHQIREDEWSMIQVGGEADGAKNTIYAPKLLTTPNVLQWKARDEVKQECLAARIGNLEQEAEANAKVLAARTDSEDEDECIIRACDYYLS